MTPDSLATDDVEHLYWSIRRIRRVEEEIARLYPTDVIRSPVHLSIGQEAISVGVIDALADDDVIACSYRSHAAYLAKGGSLKAMMAEMYGKDTGCCRGKGGSMHLISTDAGVLGSSAVVGTHIPMAAGYALAFKLQDKERVGGVRVAAVFFGDGATEEGVFSETINFAALHVLPVLFVCENNGYAIHTPLAKRWATGELVERVKTYGIPAHHVADGDIFRIRALTAEAVASMRRGGGPFFIECLTYRWREHVGPAEDFAAGYRGREEMLPWVLSDQVPRLGAMLDAGTRERIDREIEREITEAVHFAEESPFPEIKELLTHVHAI
ncbi:MAG: thiamine pyrophosphate-dependent dehydrogenase E1 component subunit alpha [Chloroflexota bacterium]